jgi:hypothetical protein
MREFGLIFGPQMMRALLRAEKSETRRLRTKVSVGDRIYAKESFMVLPDGGVVYAERFLVEDGLVGVLVPWDRGSPALRWRSPLFMPKKLSRYWAICTERREEKLQDITEAAAKAEGVVLPCVDGDRPRAGERSCYREGYRKVWDSLNAKPNDWESNPVIQVIKFEQI